MRNLSSPMLLYTMTPDALYQKKLKLDLHKTKYTYVNPRIKIVLESTANTSPATP